MKVVADAASKDAATSQHLEMQITKMETIKEVTKAAYSLKR
jgi:hypothetical protein